MLVLTPDKLLMIVAGTCVALPPLLGLLARNRGRPVMTWMLVGALPLLNIGGLIILLWTPLLAEQEAQRERELAWQASLKAAEGELDQPSEESSPP